MLSRCPEGDDVWPALPYADRKSTLDTLHMCTQTAGNLELELPGKVSWDRAWADRPPQAEGRGADPPRLRERGRLTALEDRRVDQ